MDFVRLKLSTFLIKIYMRFIYSTIFDFQPKYFPIFLTDLYLYYIYACNIFQRRLNLASRICSACIVVGRGRTDIADAHHVIIIIINALTTIIQCVHFTYDLGSKIYIAYILTYYLLSLITSIYNVQIWVYEVRRLCLESGSGKRLFRILYLYRLLAPTSSRGRYFKSDRSDLMDNIHIMDLSKIRFIIWYSEII